MTAIGCIKIYLSQIPKKNAPDKSIRMKSGKEVIIYEISEGWFGMTFLKNRSDAAYQKYGAAVAGCRLKVRGFRPKYNHVSIELVSLFRYLRGSRFSLIFEIHQL